MPQKGSKRSVLRMRFLENYCDKLFKCEQDVTRSSEVTYFFLPKEQDLQSDFTNNRYVWKSGAQRIPTSDRDLGQVSAQGLDQRNWITGSVSHFKLKLSNFKIHLELNPELKF